MFKRNELAHMVFWPNGKRPTINLVDKDGEVVGEYMITAPVRGSELAKLLPADFGYTVSHMTATTLSGKLMISTVGEFDTTVVTERNKPSLEERLERMERRDRRRQIMEDKQEKELARLRAEQVIDPENQEEEKPNVEVAGKDADGAEPVQGDTGKGKEPESGAE